MAAGIDVRQHAPAKVDRAKHCSFHANQVMTFRINPHPSLKPCQRLRRGNGRRELWIRFVVDHNLQIPPIFSRLGLSGRIAVDHGIGHEPHQLIGKFGAGRVLVKPASEGTGVIAGGAVRAVMQAVGVHDVRTKVLGSTNPHNVVRATFDALLRMKDPMELARLRGKQVDEL